MAFWAEQAAYARALRILPYQPGDGTVWPITGMGAALKGFLRVALILWLLNATLPESQAQQRRRTKTNIQREVHSLYKGSESKQGVTSRNGHANTDTPADTTADTTTTTAAPTVARLALHALRLAIFPHLAATLTALSFDHATHNMGSRLRNISQPSFGFMLLVQCVRVCLAPLLFDVVRACMGGGGGGGGRDDDDEQWAWDAAPRWIVPRAEAHKWAGAEPLGTYDGDDGSNDDAPAPAPTPPLHIPSQWYVVPHPPLLSARRALWALDNLTLRRPGTSWLLPAEQRALEWSHRPLLSASRVYARASHLEASLLLRGGAWTPRRARAAADEVRRTAPVWFGLAEWGLLPALAQMGALYALGWYVAALDLRSATSWDALPLYARCALTLGIAALVAFPSALPECILAVLLRVSPLSLPTSATCPFFQRPVAASGPADMWGRRWHQWYRRDFSDMGRIEVLPLELGVALMVRCWRGPRQQGKGKGQGQGKDAAAAATKHPHRRIPSWARALRVLGTFSTSAIEHTFVLSPFLPLRPTSPWQIPTLLLFAPSSHILHGFFLTQGVGVLLAALPFSPFASSRCPAASPSASSAGPASADRHSDSLRSSSTSLLSTSPLSASLRSAAYLTTSTLTALPLARHLANDCGFFHPTEYFGMMRFSSDWAAQSWKAWWGR